MSITDLITFLLSIFFLARGALRGFINSLIVPFSIIIATIASIIYIQTTHDVITSLLIGLIGPLFLCIILKFIFKIGVKALNADIKQPVFSSRVAGAILTLTWGWVFIIFALILLTVLPPWGERLTAVHNDVSASASYNTIAKPFGKMFFTTTTASAPDAQTLAQDPRFQKVLQDPDIQAEINAHDIAKLMSNPKMMDLVRQIMSDPDTMKKVMAVYKSQAQPLAIKNP